VRLGTRQLTVTPNGPSSRAAKRVSPITPALAAVYAGDCGTTASLRRAARDDTFTIRP
jgi:hypothetical protein